jgi:hypothetical protein
MRGSHELFVSTGIVRGLFIQFACGGQVIMRARLLTWLHLLLVFAIGSKLLSPVLALHGLKGRESGWAHFQSMVRCANSQSLIPDRMIVEAKRGRDG